MGLAGVVTGLKRRGENLIFKLDDGTASIDVIVFGERKDNFRDLLVENAVLTRACACSSTTDIRRSHITCILIEEISEVDLFIISIWNSFVQRSCTHRQSLDLQIVA